MIIILSIDILVQIQKGLDIKTIRHYGIRPCGKTPSDATLRLVEFQINMIYKLDFLSLHVYIVSTVGT